MSELSMNETTTYRWSFEEDVTHYAESGIPAMGVWRQKLSDCGQTKALELLNKANMKVSHLFWAGGFTGSDGRSYRESVEDASEALDTAAALQTKILVVHSGPRAGHTHNHAKRLFQSALAELTPKAAELGVTLAVEPMHVGCAAEWTFLNTLDEAIALLNAVGGSQVKMVLDTYHVGQSEKLVERAAELVPLVAMIQLGDAKRPPSGEQNRCRLGEGNVPLEKIVEAMESAGYNGYYDVELLGEEIETLDYHAILLHAKKVFETLPIRR
jgi:sugar phosphate isomerase/epimerase